jgi:nicotinamidase/pyrazinamidase
MPDYQPGTALIVVDVQNDFADPRGSLAVHGADAILPVVNREVARALAGRALVVCSQDWHPEHTPHFKRDGGPWPVHCVAGTWGAELHPALEIPDRTAIVRKGSNGEDGYSAFTMLDTATRQTVPTMLEPLLEEAGVRRVVIVGLATDYCVRQTALDAVRLGFETIVLTDGIAAVDLAPGDGARALAELDAAGVHLRPSDPPIPSDPATPS